MVPFSESDPVFFERFVGHIRRCYPGKSLEDCVMKAAQMYPEQFERFNASPERIAALEKAFAYAFRPIDAGPVFPKREIIEEIMEATDGRPTVTTEVDIVSTPVPGFGSRPIGFGTPRTGRPF